MVYPLVLYSLIPSDLSYIFIIYGVGYSLPVMWVYWILQRYGDRYI